MTINWQAALRVGLRWFGYLLAVLLTAFVLMLLYTLITRGGV